MTPSRSPLKRTATLLRRAPLRKQSPKHRRWLREYREAREEALLEATYRCQARLAGCLHFGTETHHRKGRVGQDANARLLVACSACHARAHAHPEEAYALGLSERRVS